MEVTTTTNEFEVLKQFPNYRIKLNPIKIVKKESDFEIKPKTTKNNLVYYRLDKQDRPAHHVIAAQYLGFEEGDKIQFKKKEKQMIKLEFYDPSNLEVIKKRKKSNDSDTDDDNEAETYAIKYEDISHVDIDITIYNTFSDYIENCKPKRKLEKIEDFISVIEDLREVFGFIHGSPEIFIIKDSYKGIPKLSYSNGKTAIERLSKVIIGKVYNEKKGEWFSFSAADLYRQYHMLLSYKEPAFYSKDPRIFSYFRGYDYREVQVVNMDLIKLFLDHIKIVICNRDEKLYKLVLQWYSAILRDPTCKLEYALLLISDEGTGKNTFFTDVLCQLMSRYSNPNVTDIEEITGTFNSIMENMKLIICNELLSVENSKKEISTKLKAPITNKTVRINEKYIPRYTTDNVANFIFVTNELIPFIMKMRNRRFCVLQLNEEFIQNEKYFTELGIGIEKPGFYEHLFTYFMRK